MDKPNINKTIYRLYHKGGYYSKYAKDIWLTVIISAVFIYAIIYFNIFNNIKPLKDDWPNQRCSTAVMPFAGIINKPEDQTNLEFTANNFNYCVQNIVESVTQYAFLPIYYAVNTIPSVFNDVVNWINSVRNVLIPEWGKLVATALPSLCGVQVKMDADGILSNAGAFAKQTVSKELKNIGSSSIANNPMVQKGL